MRTQAIEAVRFRRNWRGRRPGDVATFAAGVMDALVRFGTAEPVRAAEPTEPPPSGERAGRSKGRNR